MTVASLPEAVALPRAAATAPAIARVRLVFEGREHGHRAVARLLREPPAAHVEVELVALAVPRVPGAVRVHLAGAAATEWVIAAARGALDELAAILAAKGVACRARIATGTLSHALRNALGEGDADLVVVATGMPRWRIAWVLRDRLPAASARMIVA